MTIGMLGLMVGMEGLKTALAVRQVRLLYGASWAGRKAHAQSGQRKYDPRSMTLLMSYLAAMKRRSVGLVAVEVAWPANALGCFVEPLQTVAARLLCTGTGRSCLQVQDQLAEIPAVRSHVSSRAQMSIAAASSGGSYSHSTCKQATRPQAQRFLQHIQQARSVYVAAVSYHRDACCIRVDTA